MITIGIDPHKRSLTAAALDSNSRLLSQPRVPTTGQAAAQASSCWAVEGATGLGGGIAQLLVAAGEQVLDVPAKLAARARLLGTSSARKTPSMPSCGGSGCPSASRWAAPCLTGS